MLTLVMPILLAAAPSGIITDKMTDTQRQAVISRYISPAPGTPLKLSDQEIRDRKSQDGLKLRGFIHFNPPKGTCFTVTRWNDQDDDVICTAKDLSFSIKDLDAAGGLRWRISTGKGDFGQDYTWPSPYRIAQTIKAGDSKAIESRDLAVLDCRAAAYAEHNEITLTLHRNTQWRIRLPLVGKTKPQSSAPAPKTTEEKPKTKDAAPTPPPTPAKSALERWQLDTKKAFWMPAEHFRTGDAPPGAAGDCYYQLSGAARDPDSGWIECHNTEAFDVVFVHLPCANRLITN